MLSAKLQRVAVLHNSAQKLGVDADFLIGSVAEMTPSDRTRELFRSFVGRSPESKRLNKFVIREEMTSSGEFTYAAVN